MAKLPTFQSLIPAKAQLAIEVTLCIALFGSENAPLCGRTIEKHYGLNQRALVPILQTLTKAGVLVSISGAHGGYYITHNDINLADIVSPFLDPDASEHYTLHHLFDVISPIIAAHKKQQLAQLAKISLASLAENAKQAGVHNPFAQQMDYMI